MFPRLRLKVYAVHLYCVQRTPTRSPRQDVQCSYMAYPSKTDREAILAAAMEQVVREGIKGLSLRGLAGTLGLAPNALYRYFADRAALEAALSEESVRRLEAVLRKAAGKKAGEEAVRSIAQAYVRFAREEPEVFALT